MDTVAAGVVFAAGGGGGESEYFGIRGFWGFFGAVAGGKEEGNKCD